MFANYALPSESLKILLNDDLRSKLILLPAECRRAFLPFMSAATGHTWCTILPQMPTQSQVSQRAAVDIAITKKQTLPPL